MYSLFQPLRREPLAQKRNPCTRKLELNTFICDHLELGACSPSKPNKHSQLLDEQGCKTFHCLPNREGAFDSVITAVEPHLCVFDRSVYIISSLHYLQKYLSLSLAFVRRLSESMRVPS